jgi:hypothetical protein
LPDSGEAGGGSGGKRVCGRLEAHLRVIWVLRRGGEAGGDLARRSRAAAAAAALSPARGEAMPANTCVLEH